MSLTRKDFIILANTLKHVITEIDKIHNDKWSKLTLTQKNENIKWLILNNIIDFCKTQNAMFDENRFKNTCEVEK